MLALSFISFSWINRVNELSAIINHANLIKFNLMETYSDLSDADSELSKHILTSEVPYREAMMEFQKKIYHSIGKLKELTANSPYQSKRTSILDSLIQVRFELMKIKLHSVSRDYKKITSTITDCTRQIISMINVLKEHENKKLVEVESSLVQYKSMTPVMLCQIERRPIYSV